MNDPKQNKYAGPCDACSAHVLPGAGEIAHDATAGGWVVLCVRCASGEPTLEAVAVKSRAGRAWLAFWYVERLRPRPKAMTVEQLDALLEGYDLVAMRGDVARERARILDRYGVEMTPERVER